MEKTKIYLQKLIRENLNGTDFDIRLSKNFETIIEEISNSEYKDFLFDIKTYKKLYELIFKFDEYLIFQNEAKRKFQEVEFFLEKENDSFVLKSRYTKKAQERIIKEENLKVYSSDSFIQSANFEKDYENFKNKSVDLLKAHYCLKQILENKRSLGVYIQSDKYQVGKTHLISAFANEVYKTKKVIIEYSGTLSKMSKNFSDENKLVLDTRIEEMKSCDILIFDDFGSEKPNEYFLSEIMMPVLQHRLTNKKTTIFTSNYSISELESKYSKLIEMERKDIKRFISRICELSEVIEIKS